MKTIDIEWRHLRVEGETCERCAATGALLRELVANLNRECAPRDVRVTLTETPLGPESVEESNRVLIDGRPLEAGIPAIRVGSSACASCSDLTGSDEQCRTLELDGRTFEVPPAYLIRAEVCRLGGCC
ncbi:MAG: DUF2703 domain-containing protein [Gammaproteobacteria bacterium]|nr:DUF2703 domain-containing protein [Gammaproteobacteria bacterium]